MMNYLSITALFCCLFSFNADAQKLNVQTSDFVKVRNHQFITDDKPYYYIGTNYWYGGLLAAGNNTAAGKKRLVEELDFLKARGINNLRVLSGSEGTGQINGVTRVSPSLQPEQGVFNQEVLAGLDFLLMEMAKRKMYAVLYLSNNWEWSGGFMQYLNWNGQLDKQTLERKLSWDEQRDYTSKFYSCEPCKASYINQLDYILKHKNVFTGVAYVDEPAIMAWELANEPRPMRPEAIDAYKDWIESTAGRLRKLDKNHLITIGTEGIMGTEEQQELFRVIHSFRNIDYLTIHIWPKNWGWFKGSPDADNLSQITKKTSDYILEHEKLAKALNKPLVIEEFGLPRDGHSFDAAAGTKIRDAYFESVFSLWEESRKDGGVIAGCNFWGFGGRSRPVKGQLFWKSGDDFSADPPQEEQGLNTVFDSDSSTWKMISRFTAQPASPVSRHGALKVLSGQIVDAHHVPPQLRGVSLSWSIWQGRKYYNPEAVSWLKSDFNISLLRVAMAVQPDSGYLKDPAVQEQLITKTIDAAVNEGLYVLLDWHDHNAHLHIPASKAFFARMAKRYHGIPNVLYEIWNEPELVDWKTVRDYAVEISTEIRKYDKDNLIIVGSPHWDQDIDVVAKDRIQGINNIAYSFHFYASEPSHQAVLMQRANEAIQSGLPIFVTEWGVGEANGDGVFDLQKTEKWLAWLEKNKLSWANWNVTSKKETTALLMPEAAATGKWPLNMLTPAGSYIRSKLKTLNK